jgi:branched-chain amino acid transport system substrate-binding protein
MVRRAILFFAAFLLAGSIAPVVAATKGPAAGQTLKAGVIADVTGAAGVYGTVQKNAYELANDDIKSGLLDTGGVNLTFDVQDAASDPNQVANIMQRFTTDGTAIILGPTLSAEAFKADPIAVKANIPILATSNTADGITAMGPCVFRNSLSEAQVVPVTVDKTEARWKYKTAAIIYGDDNAFTKADYDIFKAALQKHNVKIVDVETFHTNDVDFQAQLTKIKAKHPDVIVNGALFPEATKIINQAGKLGIKAHMMGGNGLNSPKVYEVAGPNAQGVVVGSAWFIGGQSGGNGTFVSRYQKKFGTLPDQFAAQAYAAAQIVAYLAKEGRVTPAALCSGMKTMKTVQTVLGPYSFEPTRDAKGVPVVLQIVKDGFAYFK